MRISMARGDTCAQTFTLMMGDVLYEDTPDEIYFTVKKHYYEDEYIIQKTLTGHGIRLTDDGIYVIDILPEDTNDLSFGAYDFDIEVVKAPAIKKTFQGVFELTKETTHASNEHAGNEG